MSANQSMITAMAELEQSVAEKLSEMRKILGMAELAPAKAKKSAGRPKSSKAQGTEAEAEKKPLTAWIVFSSQQVQRVIRAAEESMEKSKKSKVGTVNQFAGQLWAQRHEWSDEEITAAWAEFTPPEVSKQEAEGKSKRSGSISSGGGAEPVAEDGTKSRKGGKWSEEAKASAKAKREAKKAAKAEAEAEAEVDVWGHVEVEAEAPAPATPAKKEAEPAPAPAKKVMQIKKAAPAPKKLDLSFYSITHEGADYFTNDRHDLVDAEMVWVGRLLNGKIVEAEEPEDLADATMRE